MASKLKMTVEAETAKARAELEKVNKKIDQMKESQQKANSTFENFLKGGKFLVAAKLAGDALKKIVDVSKEMIETYKVQERAELKLRNAITASGREADISADYMIRLASEYQNLTTFGDEAVISAQSLMLSYQNIGQDVFPRALKAAMDMSSALDKDLTDSVKKVGEAVENPVKNFGALKEAGIDIDEQKVRLIKTLVAENKQWQAQDIILKEIESRYGGLSEAIANTTTGKLESLGNTLGDIKEEFGEQVLNDIDGWVDIGKQLADGFLLKLKVDNAETKVRNAGDGTLRPLQEEDTATLEAMIKDADKKLAAFAAAGGQVTRSNLIGRNEVGNITAALAELAIREGEALQDYWDERQAKLKELALQQRVDNPVSANDEKFSLNASGTHAGTQQATILSTGEMVEQATSAKQTVSEFLDELSTLYGGDWLNSQSLLDANNQILDDYEKMAKTIGSEDISLFDFAEQGGAVSTLYGKYGQEALLIARDMKDQYIENEQAIAGITGQSSEWLDIMDYIEKNQVLINYSIDDRVAMLETEIEKNEAIMADMDAISKLTQEQRTNLALVTDQKKEQLDLLREEQSGLKTAKDYLDEHNSMLQQSQKYKIQAIDKQIEYNEELMKTEGLTEEQIEQYKEILALLKQQKKEAQGGGFGENTIAVQMKMNMEKPEGWDDFFKSLDNEIASLEKEFGSTVKSISDMFSALENSILDGLRNALDAAEKNVKEQTAIYEEQEDAESESRDEKMTALQEQYDADAIIL